MLVFRMDKKFAEQKRQALKDFMNWYGINASEWTNRAGMTHSTLYSFLSGDSNDIKYGTLEQLARALGVTVGMIMGEVRLPGKGMSDKAGQDYEAMPPGMGPPLKPEDTALLDIFRKFDKDGRARLIRMAEFLNQERESGKK